MRVWASVLVVALLVTATAPSTAQPTEDVVISEVHPRPASDGREFIELHNAGTHDVDLAGWNLTDGINTYTFSTWTLTPGMRVVVWGGGNDSALGPTWKANVWNNGGDTVRLVHPDGSVAHEMAYGTTDVPVPAEGKSLHGPDDWSEADPTPGQGPTGQDGSATATVQDVAPEASWTDPPSSVRPSRNVTIGFHVQDANGDDLQWTLSLDGAAVHNGTTSGGHQVVVSSPEDLGDWTWRLDVRSTSHQVQVDHVVTVSMGPFRVDLPEEGIRFPALVPGETDVVASAAFTIRHVGDADAVPRLDMSPFHGRVATLPVDGNLRLHIQDGNQVVTLDYDGPLQDLPVMAPGDRVDVTLVLVQVPDTLAAGEYRSSFTVVA